ncbi:MAG TPA: response regulator [Ktedonobacterales bacterium]|nr:response regulator [Ktedonobacterales bacterium]
MGKRILVVNDTEEILQIFLDILAPEGYDVVLYSYAINDMDEVQRIKPDLVILDLIFGQEKTGWQMLQKMKMTRATATIPVIVCTAATKEVREIQGYLQAKGVSLVPKPFDIDDLLAAVKRAFDLYGHDADIIEEREENEKASAQGEQCSDDGEGDGEGSPS